MLLCAVVTAQPQSKHHFKVWPAVKHVFTSEITDAPYQKGRICMMVTIKHLKQLQLLTRESFHSPPSLQRCVQFFTAAC